MNHYPPHPPSGSPPPPPPPHQPPHEQPYYGPPPGHPPHPGHHPHPHPHHHGHPPHPGYPPPDYAHRPGYESAPYDSYRGHAESTDACTWAMLAHLSGLLFGFLGPLIVWLIKKDESAFVADQAKEALNFQISLLIAAVLTVFSMFLLVGFLLLPILMVVAVVLPIMAALKANEGQLYRYPVNIRFIS